MSHHNRKTAIRRLMQEHDLRWAAAAALHDGRHSAEAESSPYPPVPNVDVIEVGEGVNLHLALAAHTLICGSPGTGKTWLAQLLLRHVVDHPADARAVVIDPLGSVAGTPAAPNVQHITGDATGDTTGFGQFVVQSAAALTDLLNTLRARAGETTTGEQSTPEPERLFVIVDCAYVLLDPQPDDTAEMLSARETAHGVLTSLVTHGRSLGARVVLISQHPALDSATGQLGINCGNRIVMGPVTPSLGQLMFSDGAVDGAQEKVARGTATMSTPPHSDLIQFRVKLAS